MSKKASKVLDNTSIPPSVQANGKKDEQKPNNPSSVDAGKGQQNQQKSSTSVNDPNQKSNANIPASKQGNAQNSQQQSSTSLNPVGQANQKGDKEQAVNGQKNQQPPSATSQQSKSSLPNAQQGQPTITSQSQLEAKSNPKDSQSSIANISAIQGAESSSLERNKNNKSINSKQPGEKDIKTELKPIEELPKKKNILHESGLVHAYDYFLRQLCKNGLPAGNIFEYAAQEVLKFEKMKKQDILKKYQQRSSSPLNKSSVYVSKDRNKTTDSVERPNKGLKDSQFSKLADSKIQESDNTVPPTQKNKKDAKVEQNKGNDNKKVSNDKVREESPEKKKQEVKQDNKVNVDNKQVDKNKQPTAAATKNKK